MLLFGKKEGSSVEKRDASDASLRCRWDWWPPMVPLAGRKATKRRFLLQVEIIRKFSEQIHYRAVLRIQIRRIRMFLGLQDPLERDTDLDPSIKKAKMVRKP